jgi:hypothetical protein
VPTDESDHILNDLYLLDVYASPVLWTLLNDLPGNVQGRFGHTMSAISPNQMLIFGGVAVGGKLVGELFEISFARNPPRWTNLSDIKSGPGPRDGHG